MSEFTQIGKLLSNDAIRLFKEIVCSKRHNSYDLRAINDVYKNFVEKELGTNSWIEQNKQDYIDKSIADGTPAGAYKSIYGNAYFDIPPSKGCENWSPIIIQGHSDMVEACNSKPTFPDTIEIVEDVINGKDVIHSKNYQSSIGADNGIAIALMLSMLINRDKFKHGLIRCICTADEEPGMIGAAYVPNEWINSDYMINADSEIIGDVVESCAGGYSKNFTVPILDKIGGKLETVNSGYEYKLYVSNLKMTHSADCNENMTNAGQQIAKLIYSIFKNDRTARLFSLDTDSTSVTNVVSAKANAIVISNKPLSNEKLAKLASKFQAEIRSKFSDDNEAIVNITVKTLDRTVKCLKHNLTNKLIELIDQYIFGPISYIDANKINLESSSNIGPIWIRFNNENCPFQPYPISIGFYSRSCNNKLMTLLHSHNKLLEEKFIKLFGKDAAVCSLIAQFPGWAPQVINPVRDWMIEGYKLAGIKDPKKIMLHAGVEPAWWVNKHEGLSVASIGPTISNPHTPNETLYLETFYAQTEAILYGITQMKK